MNYIVYYSEINKSVELSVREHKHIILSWPCCINQIHIFDKCAYQFITISLELSIVTSVTIVPD